MNVLIITPNDKKYSLEYNYAARENLGIEYLLKAIREQNQNAHSINLNIEVINLQEVLDNTFFEIVGFSLQFWENRKSYIQLLNSLKFDLQSLVIIGGHASTLAPIYFLNKCIRLDGVVMGEGESTIKDLIEKIDNLLSVKGIYTREGFSKRYLLPIDELSFPERDEFLRFYSITNAKAKEIYFSSSRGCPYDCTFCSVKSFYKTSHHHQYRYRSVTNVKSELEILFSNHPDIIYLSFTDDNFLGCEQKHIARGLEIAEFINCQKPDILFEFACRVDSIDRDSFKRFADLGLYGVFLGIESGSQEILNSYNKKTSIKENINAIETLTEIGIGCDLGFIMLSEKTHIHHVRENLVFLKSVMENFDVYVHPVTTFRAEKIYPKDLGVSFLTKDEDEYPLVQEVALYKNFMNDIWSTSYKDSFLNLEKLSIEKDEQIFIEKSRRLTKDLIHDAFSILNDIENSHSISV